MTPKVPSSNSFYLDRSSTLDRLGLGVIPFFTLDHSSLPEISYMKALHVRNQIKVRQFP